MRPELATDGDNGMEPNQTEEDFIRSSLEIFDGNFMIDEDVELREMFRKHPDVLAFLKKAYTIGGDKKTVDLCLEAIWEDLNEKAKSMGDYIWNPPKWTEEELRRSIEFRAERIRREAKKWDDSGDWLRAMGVMPETEAPWKLELWSKLTDLLVKGAVLDPADFPESLRNRPLSVLCIASRVQNVLESCFKVETVWDLVHISQREFLRQRVMTSRRWWLYIIDAIDQGLTYLTRERDAHLLSRGLDIVLEVLAEEEASEGQKLGGRNYGN